MRENFNFTNRTLLFIVFIFTDDKNDSKFLEWTHPPRVSGFNSKYVFMKATQKQKQTNKETTYK